jgi:hypothetical protein
MNYFAIKKLTASDFPGIDEAKFNELKVLLIKVNREQAVFCFVAAGIWFISTLLVARSHYLTTSGIILMLAIYGFGLVSTKRLRRLEKELKISDRLRAKKKGIAFTG